MRTLTARPGVRARPVDELGRIAKPLARLTCGHLAPSFLYRRGLASFPGLAVTIGVTHTGTSLVIAAAAAVPGTNAPDVGVTAALHGCADVVQVTSAPPLPRTTVVVLPTFWSCWRSTTTPSRSPAREHRTVPVMVAEPLGMPAMAFASIMSVTAVSPALARGSDAGTLAPRELLARAPVPSTA